MDPNTISNFAQTIDIIYKIVILIIAAVGIIAFFFRGIKAYKFLKKVFLSLDLYMKKSTALMDKIVPRILKGFEDKGFVAPNTLVEWTEIVSANNYTTTSPKKLNNTGKQILTDCSIKQIIDGNTGVFLNDLDSMGLKTALDVEEKSFYVLDNRKEEDIFKSLKNYIYNHSDVDIYTCLFVGSLYLRDLYLQQHPNLL